MDKKDAIDDVEHFEDCRHGRLLYLDRRNDSRAVSFVHLVHLLLQDDSLLGQMTQAFGRLLRLLVRLAQQMLVDRVRLLLVAQCSPKVALTGLCSSDQVVADGDLQTLGSKVTDVEGERMLQKLQRKIIFSDRV